MTKCETRVTEKYIPKHQKGIIAIYECDITIPNVTYTLLLDQIKHMSKDDYLVFTDYLKKNPDSGIILWNCMLVKDESDH